MANWAQKLKLHHLQTLVALGEQGNLTVAVHKKRERDPKKMRHHVVSHFT